KLFKTTSFDHSSSPEFELFSDHKEQLESLKVLQRWLFMSLEDWEVSSLQFMQRYRN
ncbi:hypothetical protein Tco_1524092, partial [Tanacetum coccineum]